MGRASMGLIVPGRAIRLDISKRESGSGPSVCEADRLTPHVGINMYLGQAGVTRGWAERLVSNQKHFTFFLFLFFLFLL